MRLPTIPTPLQKTFEPFLARLLSPGVLAQVATHMPKRLNGAITGQLLNRAFAEQIEEGDFEFLQDRILQIEILDAELFIGVSFQHQRMLCCHFSTEPGVADVTLSIDTLNAIELIQQNVDPDTLFFQRKLRINGNTELAHHVKNTLDTLNPRVIPDFILVMMQQYQRRILGAG